MPHRANRLVASVNRVAGDPAYLAERAEAIANAGTIEALVGALDLGDDPGLIEIAIEVDAALPLAVRDAVLAGYKGASALGTDGVAANWTIGAGNAVKIGQSPGTDGATDQGHVSIAIDAPPLG